MKRKLLIVLLVVISCLACAFGFAACGRSGKTNGNSDSSNGESSAQQPSGGNEQNEEKAGTVCFIVDGNVYDTFETKGDVLISMPLNPTKSNYVFVGWYWDDNTFQQPFTANSLLGIKLTTRLNVYAKWAVDLPFMFESQTYEYDGTAKSLQAYNFSDDITVTYSENNALTEVGTVQVTATFFKKDVALGSKVATLTITPATPNVTVYCNQKLTEYSEVNLNVIGNVSGSATLNGGQHLRIGSTEYQWTFIPDDSKNYKAVTGTVRLDVDALVTFESEGALFGTQTVVLNGVAHLPSTTPTKTEENGYSFRFSHWSLMKGGEAFSFDTQIIGNITLYAVYESDPIVYSITYLNTKQVANENVVSYDVTHDTISLLSISAKHYDFDGWYDEQNKKVTEIKAGTFGDITLTAKWTAKNYKISYHLNGGHWEDNDELVYTVEDVPIDLIAVPQKENYRFAGWYENTDGTKKNVTDITLAGARDYILYAQWTPYIDINSVGFTDKTYEYDGTRKSLTATNLPTGVSVEYSTNYLTDVGSLSVTATFYVDGELATTKTATLRIIKATYDMSAITFTSTAFDYDGTAKSISISGELPEGVTVFYENNNKIEAGRYTVTANFEYDTFNYNEIESLTAILTINKIHYNLSNLTFSGVRYTYDGQPKSATVLGVLPSDVTVSYTGNEKINAGTYTVVAHFESSNSNYYAIDDWAVSLIIEKADYNMNFVRFQNKTFTYDGNAKSLSVTGDIPSGVTVTYTNNARIDVGSYTITAKFAGDTSNYNIIPDMTATLTINKAVPSVIATCSQTLNLRSRVELVAQTEVDGTIVFDVGQTLVLGRSKYSWTFTPFNTNNYETVHGTVELNVYATVFYINDKTEVLQQNVSVNNSAVVPTLEPKRQDSKGLRFTFSHWSLQENGTEYDFTSPVEEDTTLYAVYSSAEIEYTITYYDTYGVANTNKTKYTVSSQFFLDDLSRDYYTFSGWYNETGVAQSQVQAGTWGNLSFVAKWTPIEYHIEYVSQHKAKNSNPATYNVESSFAFSPAVFDNPYVFEGWYADEAYTQAVTQITVGQHDDITLFAKWTFTGTYISTLEELKNVAYNMDGSYELTTDLTITGADNFEKIGDSVNPFTGYFNGGGHYVDVGLLFGVTNGTVKNITVTGQLAFSNLEQGSIYNCHSSDRLLTENQGIVDLCSGGNGLIVKNCATGFVSNSFSKGYVVYLDVTTNSYNYETDYLQYVGGFIAYNLGIVENSYHAGNIYVNEPLTYSRGGGKISSGSVEMGIGDTEYFVGGFVGYNTGKIENAYCQGDLSIIPRVFYASGYGTCRFKARFGGFCGETNSGSIFKNCYYVGDISYNIQAPRVSIEVPYWYFSEVDGRAAAFANSTTNISNCFVNSSWLQKSVTNYEAYENSSNNSFSWVTDGQYIGGTNCYTSPATNVTNFKSRDFILNILQWGEYIDEDHIADGNVWVLVNGQYPKLWFEA